MAPLYLSPEGRGNGGDQSEEAPPILPRGEGNVEDLCEFETEEYDIKEKKFK